MKIGCASCPECGSFNTTRFQWVEESGFEYWTCWECDRLFTVSLDLGRPTMESVLLEEQTIKERAERERAGLIEWDTSVAICPTYYDTWPGATTADIGKIVRLDHEENYEAIRREAALYDAMLTIPEPTLKEQLFYTVQVNLWTILWSVFAVLSLLYLFYNS